MSEPLYRLVFQGELRPGQDKETVKANLRPLLKINERQAEKLLSGKRFVVKKKADCVTADKAKAAFYGAGAILRLERFHVKKQEAPSEPTETSDKPPPITVSESERSRDVPALAVFIMACFIFVGLCGYLVWKVLKTEDIAKQVTETVTETVTEAVPVLKGMTGESSVTDSAAPKDIVEIPVSVSGAFLPVSMKISSRSSVHPTLGDSPPGYLIKVPESAGGQRKFGRLLLGTGNNRIYDFMLDIVQDGRSVLYFDLNQNKDLTDDTPLENRGSGIFATVVQIPIQQLIKEMAREGDFKIWFFTNRSLHKRGNTAHYSITQMKGRVTVEGKDYDAYIAERGNNDADFTNDGIFVDLDGDGKIDPRKEYFKDRGVGTILGKNCRFDIRW